MIQKKNAEKRVWEENIFLGGGTQVPSFILPGKGLLGASSKCVMEETEAHLPPPFTKSLSSLWELCTDCSRNLGLRTPPAGP